MRLVMMNYIKHIDCYVSVPFMAHIRRIRHLMMPSQRDYFVFSFYFHL
ncbi:TPA: leader peptide SpeFL [Aeromonas veronii]